ncbi:MAG TPA: Mur ligase domain-containing protein [Candidatus Saccharimonadales bacterium]|nr:Mur ligase domain-containing protein [Candidatus Saccharimonadales bacterium]
MHIFFSGIGGAGIGPLALVAKQAGYEVSGSDKQHSQYIDYLAKQGITDVHIGQTAEDLAAVHEKSPIDWYVYSSAVAIEQPDAPEFVYCREQDIKMSKRDELLNEIINDKKLKLIAIAGTHGKTTTTAMTVWLFKQLGIPLAYILPAKSSFAEMGAYEPGAEYFVYECDEFDRNFLSFEPFLSLITGIDWDHPDIYPTREDYNAAFREFLEQSRHTVLWNADVERLGLRAEDVGQVLDEADPGINTAFHLPGLVNRQNAWEVAHSLQPVLGESFNHLVECLDKFPGVSRRFEQIVPGLYTDYAHTPPKIRGALQLAHEVAGENVVVVYEGLHNTRQHFIRDDLQNLFDGVKKLYIVPSYLAREDKSLKLLTPDDLKLLLSTQTQTVTDTAALDGNLRETIIRHLEAGDTVVCISAGGGGSLDEWLRREFSGTNSKQ